MKVDKGLFFGSIFFFVLFLFATNGYSFTITSSTGAGGTISPSGSVPVAAGDDQTFTITPDAGYEILDVVTDSGSVGPVPSYTFTNVTSDDSITASFAACATSETIMLESDGMFYNTIMQAYGYADPLGDTILLKAGIFPAEDLMFNLDVTIGLEGGKDCSFQDSSMMTLMPGTLTITRGTVIPSNILLSGSPCEPSGPEICDGLDNDCNGLIDEWLTFDDDGDGHSTSDSCSGTKDDCDDTNPNTYPGAQELCDGLDNNCNGLVDEDDADGDGYTAPDACYGSKDDCNDNNAGIHPGAADLFGDGIDQDCSGQDLDYLPGEPCVECHTNPPSDPLRINNNHLYKVGAPDGTCQSCHSTAFPNILPGHYGRIVKSDGNNMTAGDIIRCWSCHDYHDDPDYVDYTNYVWSKVTSAPRPLTCDVCHEDRASRHLNGHNNRVILELCSHCHTSDTTILGMPGSGTLTSQNDVNTLHRSDCYLCHNYTGTKIDPATVSQAILDGNNGAMIDCLTCHGAAFTTIHEFLEGHYNLVRVGDTGCGSCHVDATDASTLVNPDNPKVHSDCSNCHNEDFSTRSYAAGKHFADYEPPNAPGDCTTCHIMTFIDIHSQEGEVDHSQAIQLSIECATCHSAPPPVVDPLDPTRHGECGLCHDPEGRLINDAAGHPAPNVCIDCHGTDLGTIHPDIATAHDATPGSEYMLLRELGTHDPAMDGSSPEKDGRVDVDCATCHTTNLVSVHASQCSTCHPTPYDTLGGNWGGGCQQDGCHLTKHDNVSDAHSDALATADCLDCHYNVGWLVDQNKCANCHAVNDPNDITPPVTTSDVQPTYILPTYINFSATDNGGLIFLGRTFYRVDGGAVQIGQRVFVSDFGSHDLEFWSVDQAGNEELPHNTASFNNLVDTTPPVTTSDTQSVYDHIPADITLTATDDNAAGIIVTYYALNGGDPQIGTSVYVPQYFPTSGQSGILDNTLEFWSEDWSMNVEVPHNTVNFKMVGGSGTLKLIWLNSDTTGSPCSGDSGDSLARANWEIRNGSTTITGSDGCPSNPTWSGVNNIPVPLSATPYYVDIFWYDSFESGLEEFPNVQVTIQGGVVELHY